MVATRFNDDRKRVVEKPQVQHTVQIQTDHPKTESHAGQGHFLNSAEAPAAEHRETEGSHAPSAPKPPAQTYSDELSINLDTMDIGDDEKGEFNIDDIIKMLNKRTNS